MITTMMGCQWFLFFIFTVIILPATLLTSATPTRPRPPFSSRRGHRHHHSSSSSRLSSSPAHQTIASSTDSLSFSPDNNVAEELMKLDDSSSEKLIKMEDSSISAKTKSSAWSSVLEDSEIDFPEGLKIIGLDADNKPFIVIPNMEHLLENENDIVSVLRSAMKEAHRNKRSLSSSSSAATCEFNYQVTVRRTGRCTRFGNIPACRSGDQLYPYARDC